MEGLRSEFTNLISKTGKIQVLFQVDKVDESLLSQGKKIALYRICQELLNNMIKHSQATEIQITLRFKDDAVELIIQDNGQGFDVNEINKSEGLGWRNNRSRVEILNGYFKIESSKGLGTSITVKIPNHD